jgi:3'-phosphoadenosine 5'-phosphosulfate sulfotransferase (PAPS reductase)/FAD synthetase
VTPLVSVSGGKDSTATLLLAIERHGVDRVRAVFADTGNEHEATYEYVRYLEARLGLAIKWLRQDFTAWWWRRRDYVRDVWPTKLVDKDGMAADVAATIVARALGVLERGPTGNPYLDLCIIKGRFPSRKAQFCTQFLKTEPLTEHALELVDALGAVESWQGVRADESESRAKLPEREDVGGGLSIYRPILRWDVDQVFALQRKHGIKPNPLYSQGMNRVGCMPCINASKDELLEISKRFPEHVDRIEEWESLVQLASKRRTGTFFAGANITAGMSNEQAREAGNVRAMVEWAKTQRGGRKLDWIRVFEPPTACSSAYGLCE